jgi:hypothetical protein
MQIKEIGENPSEKKKSKVIRGIRENQAQKREYRKQMQVQGN